MVEFINNLIIIFRRTNLLIYDIKFDTIISYFNLTDCNVFLAILNIIIGYVNNYLLCLETKDLTMDYIAPYTLYGMAPYRHF